MVRDVGSCLVLARLSRKSRVSWHLNALFFGVVMDPYLYVFKEIYSKPYAPFLADVGSKT